MTYEELFKFQMVLSEVNKEHEKQISKWGVQNHTPIEWLSILGEEVGEVNKAVQEAYFKHGTGTYEDYRKELIQVAAVACSMVTSFDRSV